MLKNQKLQSAKVELSDWELYPIQLILFFSQNSITQKLKT